MEFDVCVIGGGPAALTVSYVLASDALKVAVLCPAEPSKTNLGETLSPNVGQPLVDLGLDLDFKALQLREVSGFQSTWGGREKLWRSPLMSINGGGWLLNRDAFESMLRRKAERSGTTLLNGRATGVQQFNRGWRITTTLQDNPEVEASLIVYANGRGRAGVEAPTNHICMDKLVACIASWREVSSFQDRWVRVDSLEEGWVYSVQSAPDTRTVIYFTDVDLLRARKSTPFQAVIADAIQRAPSVSDVVSSRQLSSLSNVVVRSAATIFKRFAAGPGWLACGDAAQTVDPLSSLGIGYAIADAVAAGRAQLEFMRGNRQALVQRESWRRGEFLKYLRMRINNYGSERRWAASKFWMRRSDVGQLSQLVEAMR